MKCYAQFFYGPGYAPPEADDYETFDSIAAVKDALWERAYNNHRFPNVDSQYAEALVFLGEPTGDYPCDTCPDRQIRIGPRGGLRSELC